LTELVELCLPEWPLDDDALRPLGALRELRALDLKSTHGTGAGLRHLQALPRLERLNLFNCIRIDAAGLAEVAKLPALRVLNLGSCVFPYDETPRSGLQDDGLRALAGARSLRKLDIAGNVVSPPAVRALRAALPACDIRAGYMVKAPYGDRMEEARHAIAAGELDAAEKILDEVVAAYPEMPGPHEVASRLFAARGDRQAVVAACTRGVEIDPDPFALVARADARSKAGEHAGAIADLSAALTVLPDEHDLLLKRAEARFDAGDHAGAIEDYTALIERCLRGAAPGAVWAARGFALVLNRGCAHVERGELEAAERAFDAAVAMAPSDAGAWANRAEARFKRGRAAEALADAERALALEPENKTAREYREKARAALGG